MHARATMYVHTYVRIIHVRALMLKQTWYHCLLVVCRLSLLYTVCIYMLDDFRWYFQTTCIWWFKSVSCRQKSSLQPENCERSFDIKVWDLMDISRLQSVIKTLSRQQRKFLNTPHPLSLSLSSPLTLCEPYSSPPNRVARTSLKHAVRGYNDIAHSRLRTPPPRPPPPLAHLRGFSSHKDTFVLSCGL